MKVSRAAFVERLKTLAPLEGAESWDNVGLLVDPGPRQVKKVLLTIDLSAPVYEEAKAWGADFIVAYHPPIFSGLKSLTVDPSVSGSATRALVDNIAVYSPHTAFDVAPGRMGDWLARSLGEGDSRPIEATINEETGFGRIVQLHQPLSLQASISLLKQYLGLAYLRVAAPSAAQHSVRTVAFCPGAGASVFEKVPHADLFVTGEMRHHDVLKRVSLAQAVVLCEHTNTERGYLPLFMRELQELYPMLEICISQVDRDPLEVL